MGKFFFRFFGPYKAGPCLKKSFEPSRIRYERSHTRLKSCSLKFRALRNAPKHLPTINPYLLAGFSIMSYHSILNFSNTPILCSLYKEGMAD